MMDDKVFCPFPKMLWISQPTNLPMFLGNVCETSFWFKVFGFDSGNFWDKPLIEIGVLDSRVRKVYKQSSYLVI